MYDGTKRNLVDVVDKRLTKISIFVIVTITLLLSEYGPSAHNLIKLCMYVHGGLID